MMLRCNRQGLLANCQTTYLGRHDNDLSLSVVLVYVSYVVKKKPVQLEIKHLLTGTLSIRGLTALIRTTNMRMYWIPMGKVEWHKNSHFLIPLFHLILHYILPFEAELDHACDLIVLVQQVLFFVPIFLVF